MVRPFDIGKSGLRFVSGLERRSATATPRGVRVFYAKSRARQAIFVVDFTTVEPLQAILGYEEPGAVTFDHEVAFLGRADAHGVLQTGAAALFHGKTEACGERVEALVLNENL